MRTLAWLTLVAAALFFSGPQSVSAHPAHHHGDTAVTAPVSNADLLIACDHADEAVLVSAAAPAAEKCPHGHATSECDCCAACATGASAIATPDSIVREDNTRVEGPPLCTGHIVRQAILDLSRPPKTFA